VSTDAQERDGTSLDTQERECREYAQAKGWTVVECIKDTASGSHLDRPGIERVRQLLRQGVVDVVLAYAVDRLSRNQIHIAVLLDDIERADATLEFVTEDFENTPVGRLILNVRAFAGEVEREKIAERTMRGKLERARAGKIPQGGLGRDATATAMTLRRVGGRSSMGRPTPCAQSSSSSLPARVAVVSRKN
jgi:site-specific DNA recombinase